MYMDESGIHNVACKCDTTENHYDFTSHQLQVCWLSLTTARRKSLPTAHYKVLGYIATFYGKHHLTYSTTS